MSTQLMPDFCLDIQAEDVAAKIGLDSWQNFSSGYHIVVSMLNTYSTESTYTF